MSAKYSNYQKKNFEDLLTWLSINDSCSGLTLHRDWIVFLRLADICCTYNIRNDIKVI